MNQSFPYQLHTFDSGLRLVTVPMPGTKTATVYVLVGTGSKYETKEINGISHFLEHMMFKGTAKRPDKLQIARELESIGADFNAFTGKEYTGYYARSSSSKLDTIMDVVFDIFLNSRLDAHDIDTERGVIIEEINMYQDLPQHFVHELFDKLLYGDTPAGWDIAGEKEIIEKLTHQQFLDYFGSHYIASNTVVAVAGDIDPALVKEKTAEYFKSIRRGEKVSKPAVIEAQTEPGAIIHFKETDQTHFVLGFRGIHMYDNRKYGLAVLASILGGGMSSRLFQEVRDRRGLAYYVGASADEYTDTGTFVCSAGVNNTKAVEAIKVIMQEIQKIKDHGITADELQKAKDKSEGSLAIMLENSRAVAQTYAWPVLFENKVLTPEEELAKIKAVTAEEIQALANEIFRTDRLNLALIGPFKDSEPFKQLLTLS